MLSEKVSAKPYLHIVAVYFCPLGVAAMGSRRQRRTIAVALLFLFLAAAYAVLLYSSPLPIRIMDRDSSGLVSLGEAIDAYDVGRRPSEGNPGCTEVYWLKDGLPAVLDCGGGFGKPSVFRRLRPN